MGTIVIDVGHGWRLNKQSAVFDPGAVGKLDSAVYYEHHIARSYAESLLNELRDNYGYGERVKLLVATRTEPLNLTTRKRYEPNADAFVSIHLNASTNELARGYEVWYNTQASEPLARALLDACTRALDGLPNRGLKQRAFTVLTRTRPSALVELGFITNQSDLRTLLLPTTRSAWARATASALHRLLNPTRG